MQSRLSPDRDHASVLANLLRACAVASQPAAPTTITLEDLLRELGDASRLLSQGAPDDADPSFPVRLEAAVQEACALATRLGPRAAELRVGRTDVELLRAALRAVRDAPADAPGALRAAAIEYLLLRDDFEIIRHALDLIHIDDSALTSDLQAMDVAAAEQLDRLRTASIFAGGYLARFGCPESPDAPFGFWLPIADGPEAERDMQTIRDLLGAAAAQARAKELAGLELEPPEAPREFLERRLAESGLGPPPFPTTGKVIGLLEYIERRRASQKAAMGEGTLALAASFAGQETALADYTSFELSVREVGSSPVRLFLIIDVLEDLVAGEVPSLVTSDGVRPFQEGVGLQRFELELTSDLFPQAAAVRVPLVSGAVTAPLDGGDDGGQEP